MYTHSSTYICINQHSPTYIYVYNNTPLLLVCRTEASLQGGTQCDDSQPLSDCISAADQVWTYICNLRISMHILVSDIHTYVCYLRVNPQVWTYIRNLRISMHILVSDIHTYVSILLTRLILGVTAHHEHYGGVSV